MHHCHLFIFVFQLSLKLLAIDGRLAELGEVTDLGAMSSTELQLLQVLGSVNGSFDPKHLASVLFPALRRKRVCQDPMGLTQRQHTAILKALGDDELRFVVHMCACAPARTIACTHAGMHA